uniref:Uncharacterized protein n=1 Tax=Anopheles melas TaxID=34690 RepID=A0A182TWW7_9DIPT
MLRAQRPVGITAGKFCFMNMEQFGEEQPAGMPHISIKLLRVFGVTGGPDERFRILPVMLTYVFCIVVPKCFYGYPNQEIAIIGIAELFFLTNSFCGMFLLYLNRHKLAQFIRHVRTFSLTAVVQHLTTQHDFIHKITRIYCIVVMFAAHFYVLTPFLSTLYAFYGTVRNENATMHFALQIEENFYGLQTRTTTSHYLLFGMIMTPTVYLCAFTGTVKTVTICDTTIHCILYFQLVQLKLRIVAQDNTFRHELKTVVKMHQDALNCASLLESITSLVLLLQLILCVLIWSSMLLYFTVSGFDLNFMSLIVLFVFDTTETFAYCYLGEQLSYESAHIAHIVYKNGWERQHAYVQKDLQLIIARAQRPVGIAAGKFCYMNMIQLGIVSCAHFYVLTPLLSTFYAFYGTVRNDNVTVHYTLQMEENFYGLQTLTTTSHYLVFGMFMTPTIYLCAFTGTVKILSICNITMYCTLFFQLVQLKLRTVTEDNTFNHQEVKSIVVMHRDALNCASLVESITFEASVVGLAELFFQLNNFTGLLLVLVSSKQLQYLVRVGQSIADEGRQCTFKNYHFLLNCSLRVLVLLQYIIISCQFSSALRLI